MAENLPGEHLWWKKKGVSEGGYQDHRRLNTAGLMQTKTL